MSPIPFIKMHGLGNDFVVLDQRAGPANGEIGPDLVRLMCRRHFGIGADQLLLILPSSKADVRMRVFNADGGEVEMCGNGVRCLAHYLYKSGSAPKGSLTVETLAGIVKPEIVGDLVRVDMGRPILEAARIPTTIEGPTVVMKPLHVEGEESDIAVTCVSMGNPHTVIFVEDVARAPVARLGSRIETHAAFPMRTNVEFAEPVGKDEMRLRVWERGSGETLACGSGACAAAVAGVLAGRSARTVLVHLPGGDLEIGWSDDGWVRMTGPAAEVYRGEVDPEELCRARGPVNGK